MANPTLSPLRCGIVILLPILGACATKGSPPTAQLSQAELALQSASQSQAATHAPLELSKARDNIREARQSVDKERYEEAERYAEKAIVEAQLAQAKAEAQVATSALEEMRENINTLQQEGQRAIEQQKPTN